MILAISTFNEINPDELWLAFGTAWTVHLLTNMDPRICGTIPMFQAFTGCDTVSAFCGRGKKTAWNTWKV